MKSIILIGVCCLSQVFSFPQTQLAYEAQSIHHQEQQLFTDQPPKPWEHDSYSPTNPINPLVQPNVLQHNVQPQSLPKIEQLESPSNVANPTHEFASKEEFQNQHQHNAQLLVHSEPPLNNQNQFSSNLADLSPNHHLAAVQKQKETSELVPNRESSILQSESTMLNHEPQQQPQFPMHDAQLPNNSDLVKNKLNELPDRPHVAGQNQPEILQTTPTYSNEPLESQLPVLQPDLTVLNHEPVQQPQNLIQSPELQLHDNQLPSNKEPLIQNELNRFPVNPHVPIQNQHVMPTDSTMLNHEPVQEPQNLIQTSGLQLHDNPLPSNTEPLIQNELNTFPVNPHVPMQNELEILQNQPPVKPQTPALHPDSVVLNHASLQQPQNLIQSPGSNGSEVPVHDELNRLPDNPHVPTQKQNEILPKPPAYSYQSLEPQPPMLHPDSPVLNQVPLQQSQDLPQTPEPHVQFPNGSEPLVKNELNTFPHNDVQLLKQQETPQAPPAYSDQPFKSQLLQPDSTVLNHAPLQQPHNSMLIPSMHDTELPNISEPLQNELNNSISNNPYMPIHQQQENFQTAPTTYSDQPLQPLTSLELPVHEVLLPSSPKPLIQNEVNKLPDNPHMPIQTQHEILQSSPISSNQLPVSTFEPQSSVPNHASLQQLPGSPVHDVQLPNNSEPLIKNKLNGFPNNPHTPSQKNKDILQSLPSNLQSTSANWSSQPGQSPLKPVQNIPPLQPQPDPYTTPPLNTHQNQNAVPQYIQQNSSPFVSQLYTPVKQGSFEQNSIPYSQLYSEPQPNLNQVPQSPQQLFSSQPTEKPGPYPVSSLPPQVYQKNQLQPPTYSPIQQNQMQMQEPNYSQGANQYPSNYNQIQPSLNAMSGQYNPNPGAVQYFANEIPPYIPGSNLFFPSSGPQQSPNSRISSSAFEPFYNTPHQSGPFAPNVFGAPNSNPKYPSSGSSSSPLNLVSSLFGAFLGGQSSDNRPNSPSFPLNFIPGMLNPMFSTFGSMFQMPISSVQKLFTEIQSNLPRNQEALAVKLMLAIGQAFIESLQNMFSPINNQMKLFRRDLSELSPRMAYAIKLAIIQNIPNGLMRPEKVEKLVRAVDDVIQEVLVSKFSNVLGAVYRKGDLLFTPDGNSVISPIGNRICIYNLKNNTVSTLPIESRYNYECLALSPSGTALIAVNEEGEAHLITLVSRRIVFTYRFNQKVRCIRFSPDGKYFAVCKISKLFVFKAPGSFSTDFSGQFTMEKVFTDFYDDTTFVDWSDDSRLLAIGSKDGTTKIYGFERMNNFRKCILAGHTDGVVAAFFETNSADVNTLSRNGQLCVWECDKKLDDIEIYQEPEKFDDNSDAEDDIDLSKGEDRDLAVTEEKAGERDQNDEKNDKARYRRLCRHYLNDLNKSEKHCYLTASDYQKKNRILVTGFSSGNFFIHELPDVTLIHSLNISETSISSIKINNTGDWIVLGCQNQGQLLVWEWQSETYILKQQAHGSQMSCLDYSPDGLYIVTGGEDGKVKVWNTQTGFCFITFNEHTTAISAVKFGSNRKFILSASLDGTIRAFDMTRYRNFRTFTTPKPVQFSCLAIDSSNELVAAGGQDVFEIYLWSMKIGHLLECLSGHEGPVVSIAFSPIMASSAFVSVSWDKTVKLWNTLEAGRDHEIIQLLGEGLCVAYSPCGKEVAVSSLDGLVTFFNVQRVEEVRSIEGRNDLGSGRSETDFITAKKNLEAKAFTSICYSADGLCLIAAGRSKFVCIYNIENTMLLKKFEITQNRSLDALDDFVNHRKMTEFGNMDLIEKREEAEGGDVKIRLPGVAKGDMAARSLKPEIRVSSIAYSPTGMAWAAASTEGVLIYSLDSDLVFDPFQLEESITPDSIKNECDEKNFTKATIMALKLNETALLKNVFESVPPDNIPLTVTSLPKMYVDRLIKYVAVFVESATQIEYYLIWIENLLNYYKSTSIPPPTILLTLHRNLSNKYHDLAKVCDFNKYSMDFLLKMHANISPVEKCLTIEINDDGDDQTMDECLFADIKEEISDN